MGNIDSPEVADRGSETQLQGGGNLGRSTNGALTLSSLSTTLFVFNLFY